MQPARLYGVVVGLPSVRSGGRPRRVCVLAPHDAPRPINGRWIRSEPPKELAVDGKTTYTSIGESLTLGNKSGPLSRHRTLRGHKTGADISITVYLQKSVVFCHNFIPQNSAHNCLLRGSHGSRVGPWLQLDLILDNIGKTTRPFIPGELVGDILDCLGVDQFGMCAHIV